MKVLVSDNSGIRRYTSTGVLEKTFVCGANCLPFGIATSGSGSRIFVTNGAPFNGEIITLSQDLEVLDRHGSFGGGDGQFNGPSGIALDGWGNVYVSDTGNFRVQKFDPNMNHLRSFGQFGSGPGQFSSHTYLAIGPGLNGKRLWVSDTGNNRIQEFDLDGNFLGQINGLNNPSGIGQHANGRLFIADHGTNQVLEFDGQNRVGAFPALIVDLRGLDVSQAHTVLVASEKQVQLWNVGSLLTRTIAPGSLPFGAAGTGGSVQFSSPGGLPAGLPSNRIGMNCFPLGTDPLLNLDPLVAAILGQTCIAFNTLDPLTLGGPGTMAMGAVKIVAFSLAGKEAGSTFELRLNGSQDSSGRVAFRQTDPFGGSLDLIKVPVRGQLRAVSPSSVERFFDVSFQLDVEGLPWSYPAGPKPPGEVNLENPTDIPCGLDETCNLTVSGQTVQVSPNGSFLIRNVGPPSGTILVIISSAGTGPQNSEPTGTGSDLGVSGQFPVITPFTEVGPDSDEDGFPEQVDNCPKVANPLQKDGDGNGIGDLCDREVLYLPYLQSGQDSFTGLAVANFSSQSALVQFEAFLSDGSAAGFPTNPATFTLGPNCQLAQQAREIFGIDEGSEMTGWIELTSENRQIGSFFQCGTLSLSQLDGSVPVEAKSTHFYFPRVFEGPTAFRGRPVTTFLSIVNPNAAAVTMQLTLHPGAGAQITSTKVRAPFGGTLVITREIAARGVLYDSVGSLFGDGTEIAEGYLEARVIVGRGVGGFELIQLLDEDTVIGINASNSNLEDQAFSAQLASAETVFTSVNLINTTGSPKQLLLRAVGPDGTNLVEPVTRTLASGQQMSEDASSLFGLESSPAASKGVAQGTPFVGSLEVNGAAGIIGDVIFGDPTTANFAASLPLQTQTFTDAIFNQVANVPGFFTGLAFYNPGNAVAEIQIRVFSADGTLVGETTLSLGPGNRQSALVDEFVAASAGQAGGYVRLTSNLSIIAQLIFGAISSGEVTLFSAVPPTIIQD